MTLGLTVTDLREYLDQVPDRAAQRVTVTGSPTGGTYTLIYQGTATVAIAHNATPATVQAAITTVAATAADTAPVTVYGSAGGPYLVVWSARSARIASPLTLGTNSLTGGSSPSVTIAVALDALLQDILDRACAMVESALLPVAYATYGAASVETVRTEPYRTTYFRLPAHQHGSVSLVVEVKRLTDTTGTTIDTDDYVQKYGYLIAADVEHRWRASTAYRVTAVWGYGSAPADVQQVALELAVNAWRQRDRGLYSEVQGVEGGGSVSYLGGINATQRMVINRARAQWREVVT
jgi:hypothetical protein